MYGLSSLACSSSLSLSVLCSDRVGVRIVVVVCPVYTASLMSVHVMALGGCDVGPGWVGVELVLTLLGAGGGCERRCECMCGCG